MWTCGLKDVRERRNRWHIEGDIVDSRAREEMSFSITIRFGWLSVEAVSGSLFDKVFDHFVRVLGEPKEPPTCAGAPECRDDAVHLVTNWEIGEENPEVAALLERLLRLPEGDLARR